MAAMRHTHANRLDFAPSDDRAGPRVLVIAEIGVNHDGCGQRALQLVADAADAGADAVKLQLFDPRHLLSNQAKLAAYQADAQERDVFAMLDRLKLDLDAMRAVRDAAKWRGLGFIVTPFSLEDIDALAALGVDAVKIASPDVVNTPLVRAAAALGLPMLVSTGAAAIDELEPAVALIRDRPACLLQCISSYPTPMHEARLGAMAAMAQRFDLPMGYSDHTTQLMTGALAVAAGACVIEKHFTYDRAAAGPDHRASFEPGQFAEYVQLIRAAGAALGPRAKRHVRIDDEVRDICRQSVCVRRDLPAGHVLTGADLTVRRPGSGIPAADLDAVIGMRLSRAVRGGDLLQPADVREQAA